MKSTAFIAYPVHIMLLNSSGVYVCWLDETELTLTGFLPAKEHKGKNSELSGVSRGESAQYWLTETDIVPA